MTIINARQATIIGVARQKIDPAVLAGFVRRKLHEQRLDVSQVQERARRLGWEIHQSYVSRIVAGKAGHLTVPKLQALAAGIGCSEDEIFAVARGVEKPEGYTGTDFFVLWEKTQQLSDPRHRDLVLEMITMIKRKVDDYLEEESRDPLEQVAGGRS